MIIDKKQPSIFYIVRNKMKLTTSPVILLSGKKKHQVVRSDFSLLAPVHFYRDYISIKTVPYGEIERMEIVVYEGSLGSIITEPGLFTVSGLINVKANSIYIDGESAYWEKGLTHVIVVLDCDQVSNRSIQSITLFLEHCSQDNTRIYRWVDKNSIAK